ncbi:MAG: fatty acid oxidation complex subunit alpha FadJ, partial [Pseudoalteromonas nigrifaciens]
GDIGAIFGIGFPPFFGGPFSYMDKLGASKISSDMSTLGSSNAVFTPCDTLVAMAESGAKFYAAQPSTEPTGESEPAEQATDDAAAPSAKE